jgi:hypothetical protein
MNTTHTLNLLVNPLMMWNQLAWKTGEMALASAQVIAQRTSRLTGTTFGQRDQLELALMGREKGEAVLESAQAVWMRMLRMNQQFAVLALQQMLATSVGLMSLSSSRSVTESAVRQSKLVRDAMTNSGAATAKLSGAAADLVRTAAGPVHTRINRNVKRLRRRAGR